MSGGTFKRLIKALEHVYVFSFRQLSDGRAHEGLTDQQLHELLIGLSKKEGVFGVAFEILGTRVFGLKSDKKPVSEAVKATG
jgi:TolB-like protein